MRYIEKSPQGLENLEKWKVKESESLKNLYSRGNIKAIWAHLPSNPSRFPEVEVFDYTKRSLKDELNIEQGFICCYCQKRVSVIESDHDLEHLIPKSINPEKFTYEYTNLCVSCKYISKYAEDNNQIKKRPLNNATCNEFRKDVELNVLPTYLGVEDRFTYTINGQIVGIDSESMRAIDILNLNSPELKSQRKNAIESVLLSIDGNELNVDELSVILENLYKRKNDKLEEYCQVLIYIIKFKISINK